MIPLLTLFMSQSNNPFVVPKINPPPHNPNAGRNRPRSQSTPSTSTFEPELDHQMCNICLEVGPMDKCYNCETINQKKKKPQVHGDFATNSLYPDQEYPVNDAGRRRAQHDMDYTTEIPLLSENQDERLINNPLNGHNPNAENEYAKPAYLLNPLNTPLTNFETPKRGRGNARKMY